MTPKPHFKVTSLFDTELFSETVRYRYIRSYKALLKGVIVNGLE